MNIDKNTDSDLVGSPHGNPDTANGQAQVFEHRIERLGRQTTHYIKSDSTTFYFSRRPGQTEDQMRELGQWIASTLNKSNPNTTTN